MMRTPAHRRVCPYRDERGFTLMELLVVLLIVGILLAMVVPTFLDQRAKGEDAAAKTTLHTAVAALMTHYTSGDSFGATVAELEAIEPALGSARELLLAGDEATYQLSERSESGTMFTLTRVADGSTTRTCSNPGYGLCRDAPDGAGNWW